MGNISLTLDVRKAERVQLSNPARVELWHRFATDRLWIGSFTLGCRTVALFGPSRTLQDANAPTVTHTVWIRTLPAPFDGTVDADWLSWALEANFLEADDVLAVAMQYMKGAAPLFDGRMRIAGDAGYGPLGENGRREEGADFNDYLGLPWHYPGGGAAPDKPEARQQGCLDCSGYMRMVWGFRRHLPGAGYGSGIPLCLAAAQDSSALPRRAAQMAASAPGVVLLDSDARPAPAGLQRLQPGDLLFFNVDPKDDSGGQGTLDHVGLYLGIDRRGQRRFAHSPKTANGPTMGDAPNPPSILDGQGLYAAQLRLVRRL